MPVVGSDGIVPIYDPEGLWKTWALYEIYTGQEGENKYVPKIRDWVVDPDTQERWRVVDLDETTLIAELRRLEDPPPSGDFGDLDILLGVGPGTQSDTYRVYIDKSVLPYRLAVDARLKVNARYAQYCQIFYGSQLDGTAEVISAFYDQMGNLLGTNVPLELAAMPGGQNYTVRSVAVCSTTKDLLDNDIVTAVLYDDTGFVISKRQLIVENTAYIRSTDASQKYITGIELESPFLSQSDPFMLELPMNVPVAGMNLFGVVNYSDGSKLRLPVDGTKFTMLGLHDHVSTIVGAQVPLALKYTLAANEYVYGMAATNERFITVPYRARVMAADGIYGVKLFGYPVWIDGVNGYRMEWFLFNLDRQIWNRATAYVRFNENYPAFQPTSYGILQRCSVSVNLRDVNGIYKNYVHTQIIDIVLVRPGNDHSGTNWTIGYELGQNPPFGRDNYADLTFINQNLRKVKIDQGETVQSEWLARLYRQTLPLYDPTTETQAPEPNMFALVIGDTVLEYPIAQWSNELTFSEPLPDSGTLFIKFFKRNNDTDLELAMSALPVWQQP